MGTGIRQFLNQASILVPVAAFAAVLVLPGPAWSQSSNNPGMTVTSPAAVYSLDGQKFKVRIVRDGANEMHGKNRGLGDILSFNNGKFSSEICRRYNFADAPYWIRVEGSQTRFLAELKSPTDGTMRWQGTIRGETLEGTMHWRRERWYWTIDAKHEIRGTLQKGVNIGSPRKNQDASQLQSQ